MFAGLKNHYWKYCSLIYFKRKTKTQLADRKNIIYKTSEQSLNSAKTLADLIAEALFRCEKILDFVIVVFSFVCDKYCLIID